MSVVVLASLASACQRSDQLGVLNTCSFAIEADADTIDTFSNFDPTLVPRGEGVAVGDVPSRATEFYAKARRAESAEEFVVWNGPFVDLGEPLEPGADYDREVVVGAEVCALISTGS